MAKLSPDKLKCGMVTLTEVIDSNGHVLIRANEELSEKHILLLKMWGISEVDINHAAGEIDPAHFSANFSKQQVAEAIAHAEHAFKFHNNEDKVVKNLKKHYIERTLEGGDF